MSTNMGVLTSLEPMQQMRVREEGQALYMARTPYQGGGR